MRLRDWLIPQDKIFFTLLERQSSIVLEGAEKLVEMLRKSAGNSAQLKKLKDIEHKGDKLLQEIFRELNQTFITPIDKEDITLLASKFDDTLDAIYASANRIHLYEVKPSNTMLSLADLVLRSTRELKSAMAGMKNAKMLGRVEEHRIEVNRLENEADDVLNIGLVSLFKAKNAIKIMKEKEIIDFLELASDSCEDAANVIGDILIKHR